MDDLDDQVEELFALQGIPHMTTEWMRELEEDGQRLIELEAQKLRRLMGEE